MAKINYNKYQKHIDFINEYSGGGNAATSSKYDPNANIENKNVATLSCEMHKEDDIGVNRLRMLQKLTELYGE
jgi:ribonucleoside-triphosphate reductase